MSVGQLTLPSRTVSCTLPPCRPKESTTTVTTWSCVIGMLIIDYVVLTMPSSLHSSSGPMQLPSRTCSTVSIDEPCVSKVKSPSNGAVNSHATSGAPPPPHVDENSESSPRELPLTVCGSGALGSVPSGHGS